MPMLYRHSALIAGLLALAACASAPPPPPPVANIPPPPGRHADAKTTLENHY